MTMCKYVRKWSKLVNIALNAFFGAFKMIEYNQFVRLHPENDVKYNDTKQHIDF